MTSYFANDSIIRSWLKLLEKEAMSRNYSIDFPPQLWHFTIDESDMFIAGKVHTAERENYDPPNEDRIFFGREDELNHEGKFSHGTTVSVILDIYSNSNQFEREEDHFMFVYPDLAKTLPGSNDRPSIYLEDHSKGGKYYYYSQESNDRKYIEPNDWDFLFDKI